MSWWGDQRKKKQRKSNRILLLEQKILELEKTQIWGFYEESYPSYAQGPPETELQELVTASDCNVLIEKLKVQEQKINELKGVLEDIVKHPGARTRVTGRLTIKQMIQKAIFGQDVHV